MRQGTSGVWIVLAAGGLLIAGADPAAAKSASKTVGVLIIVPERDPRRGPFEPEASALPSPVRRTRTVLRQDRRVIVVHTATPPL